MINVTTQNVDRWKKRIENPAIKGSTYFMQRKDGTVDVTASANHQRICSEVLGAPNAKASLKSYIMWVDVRAIDLVEVLYQIARSEQRT
jgi:hypothetical protein